MRDITLAVKSKLGHLYDWKDFSTLEEALSSHPIEDTAKVPTFICRRHSSGRGQVKLYRWDFNGREWVELPETDDYVPYKHIQDKEKQ